MNFMPNSNDFEPNSLNITERRQQNDDVNLSDEILLGMVAKGNKRAFSVLYERYLSVIYNYIFFQVNGDHQSAYDRQGRLKQARAAYPKRYSPESIRFRLNAALINPRCVKACGKLPRCSARGPSSSAYSPR